MGGGKRRSLRRTTRGCAQSSLSMMTSASANGSQSAAVAGLGGEITAVDPTGDLLRCSTLGLIAAPGCAVAPRRALTSSTMSGVPGGSAARTTSIATPRGLGEVAERRRAGRRRRRSSRWRRPPRPPARRRTAARGGGRPRPAPAASGTRGRARPARRRPSPAGRRARPRRRARRPERSTGAGVHAPSTVTAITTCVGAGQVAADDARRPTSGALLGEARGRSRAPTATGRSRGRGQPDR